VKKKRQFKRKRHGSGGGSSSRGANATKTKKGHAKTVKGCNLEQRPPGVVARETPQKKENASRGGGHQKVG